MADPHDVLGVPVGATADEVQAAYRRLARTHHPDAPGGDVERMRAINEAYAALKDGSPLPATPPPPNRGAWGTPTVAHAPQNGGLRLPSTRTVVVALVALALVVAVLAVLAATGDEVVEPRTATFTARSLQFTPRSLHVAKDTPLELRLVNQDLGQRHDLVLLRGDIPVARGEAITGPAAVAYDIGPLPAGAYTVRCSIVPQMAATLVVR